MKQSKPESWIEAIVNTIIGFVITMLLLPLVNMVCGIEMSVGQASVSTALFTAFSVLRGYLIRRVFNNFQTLKQKIAYLIKRTWNLRK